MINPVKSFLTHGPLLTLGVVIFFFWSRGGEGGNVSLSLQFGAGLCYFLSFNLIATKQPFFSDCIGGDVSALSRISITYMMWVCRRLID